MSFVIRRMKEKEVQIALDWAQKEAWNPGFNDRTCFYNADPEGFFIGLLNGEPVATGAAVIYSDNYAFCGLYIVKPEYRGLRFGLQLTEERLKYVGSRVTGIDGVVENVEKYKRLGYVPAYKNIRFKYKPRRQFTSHSNVIPLKNVPFEQLEQYDRRFFPAPRMAFLHCWIHQPDSYSLAYMKDEKVCGYGVMRKCIEGYKVGPLFADTPEIAEALFDCLCSKIKEGPIFLDIPEPNVEGQKMTKQYQMTKVFEVMRMYRNGFPEVDLQGTFGVTTFELG